MRAVQRPLPSVPPPLAAIRFYLFCGSISIKRFKLLNHSFELFAILIVVFSPLSFSLSMGTLYKKKQHVPPTDPTNKQENEMDLRTIMKDVENFSNSHLSWKERKKIEDKKVVSLGGKPLKNQRLPLSVARPMMKKQKQREEEMLQERMILGRFGGKIGGSSSKKPVGKHKPEDRGLKLSEGRFRNGILDVKHLLKSTPTRGHDTGKNMSNTGKRKGGNGKHDKKYKMF